MTDEIEGEAAPEEYKPSAVFDLITGLTKRVYALEQENKNVRVALESNGRLFNTFRNYITHHSERQHEND